MVHFVGAGTGAPDLITVRGAGLIKEADVIIYTGSLINTQLLNDTKVGCKKYDSAYLTLDDVIGIMQDAESDNLNIVRLHTGEPSIYGAVREQMDRLDELGIRYDSCPGVSACFGAAADMNIEYTLPGVTQTLIITRIEGRTPVPETEKLESLASHNCSMAIYLSSGMLDKVQDSLLKGGLSPDTPTAIVYKATWEDEKILKCKLSDLYRTGTDNGIDRLAIVLVGDAIEHASYDVSKLYDPGFATGYRNAVSD
ncbi:MAG: precorrin-4 C(11)-methyltransferase [Lachnospiraceae bacterium]|nr:precorrin-4 C(11)-methyltransferase [Lachnospiraceae bacterium]